jgi:N-acetylmuramoyl-L-alanine amidase
MTALERLMTGIIARWDIPSERVIGHSDCALGRKIDPGTRFDWKRLALQDLSVWPAAAAVGDFTKDCAQFGYVAEDGQQDMLLAAFRMRFRPWATGPLDDTDRALAADLAARYPAQPFNPLTS